MANNTYNFVNIEGNQVPLLTRTEILSGETQISNSGDQLLYVFGNEHPSNFHFDFGETPDPDSINYNWGRYDVPGIKRNRASITDPEGEMGDIVDEAGILIRNTTQFEIQVMGYFGNNFNKDTAVVASAENPNENVGYWAQIDSMNKIQNGEAFSRRYAWMHDQYGNEMERIYLYVQYTNNTVLQNATTSTKATIESDALAGNEDYNIEIARIVGSALQIPTSNDNFLFTSPDDAEFITQDVGDGVIIGQINIQVPGGVFKMHYEGDGVESFQFLEAGSTYEEMVFGTIVDRGYLLIDTDAADDAEKNIIVDHSSIQNEDEEGVESDMSMVAFTWPTLQGTVTKVTFFAMSPATGIISGSVEGSFLSGANVTGTDTNGNEMIAITNSNGYYEFPREAVGEIKARGGSNEITGENYDEAEADEIEIVTQDLVTDSSMGGIISPVSTLLTELKNNEGLDNDEALELLAEQGQELFDLPSNLADKSKIKQYLQIGLNGLQNSEGDDVEEYAGFLQLSKKIAEQEQLFVDTNLVSNTQKAKKKRAANDYRQSLTRFMKRKKDGDVAKYKTDYLTKAGTDSTASAINDSAPSQKDQFYLVLADAVEKVDGYVSDNERLASSKADFKLKAKEMMEETIDNAESISTSGKDYEAIAIELNEAYMIRKMAAREEQHARYQGNKSTFAAKKTAQTFAISKTSEGYVRSGSIIKQIGESKVEVSSNAKTRSTFLENTNVAKYNSKIKEGGVEKQLQKKSTGKVSPEVRETENTGVTGLEIRNPNYVIISVGMSGFDSASSFGGNSNSYSIEASSGIKKRGRGLNNNITVYNFIIKDSNGEIISPSYNNNLEFRRVANAFVELYSVHGSTEVQETEVYEYLNPFIVESIDSDGDGVIDSLDAFPNDASETVDSDGDDVGDNADAFPNDASETADSDGDGVGDNEDDLPNDPTETVDTDGDGTGDNADTDDDNDTYSDEDEIEAGTDPKDSESYPEPSEVSPQGRQKTELTTNLKGFFTTNEGESYSGEGTTIYEVSGLKGGTDATLRNGVSYVNDDTSVNVPYFVFDGVDDHFTWAHNANIKIGVGNRGPGMTYSFWIKPNAKTAHIMNNDGYGTSYYYGVNVGFYNSGRIFTNEMNQGHPQRMGKYNRDLTFFDQIEGKYPLQDAMTNGDWVHVCITYTDFGGGRNKALYINGQLWNSMSNGNGYASNYRRYVDYTEENGGSIGIMGASTAYYSGGFESVKIFQGPLSARDVEDEFNARKGLFNLGGE